MFDPHIYACQSFVSGSNASPIQSVANDLNQKTQTPIGSPQKNKHVNSNTVIPIQSTGTLTPQRKQSHQEDGNLRDITVVADGSGTEMVTTVHLNQNMGSGTSSANNSRKTSTVSDMTPNDLTPENTVLTPKTTQDPSVDHQAFNMTPTSALDNHQVKQSPVRKLSRFLVSPTVIETANKELMVQEGSLAPVSSPQLSEIQTIPEMNINEENYQRSEVPEAELQPQQPSGFRMPETLEQLKIELENITHAHVSTKAKELMSAQQSIAQGAQNLENEDSHETVSEAQMESGADFPSMEAVGSITTGDNTSVYNSRRTSADMNTNPTDLTSTASGILEYEENLVSEGAPNAVDDVAPPKTLQPVQQQMSSIDR